MGVGKEKPPQILPLLQNWETNEAGWLRFYKLSGPKFSGVRHSQDLGVGLSPGNLVLGLPFLKFISILVSAFALRMLCFHFWCLEIHMWVRISAVSFLGLSLLTHTNFLLSSFTYQKILSLCTTLRDLFLSDTSQRSIHRPLQCVLMGREGRFSYFNSQGWMGSCTESFYLSRMVHATLPGL